MRPVHFVFTAPMPGGPWRKVFTCPVEFDAYTRNWREQCGDTVWVSVCECRGAL
jgi:hypothetical protein